MGELHFAGPRKKVSDCPVQAVNPSAAISIRAGFVLTYRLDNKTARGFHPPLRRDYRQTGSWPVRNADARPPAAVLLKMAAKLAKASGEPNRIKIGSVTQNDLKEIAETKMVDLNAGSVEAAMRMIEGTARSMGITVEQN